MARRTLLFDLGGVLIENATFVELATLLPEGGARAASSLADRWLDSPAVQGFERGAIDRDAFAASFVAEWALAIPAAEFLERFAGWPRGPYPGALALLDGLRPRHGLACLSNSNALHWERLGPVLGQFDQAFSSHLYGLVKPDPAIFRRVAADLRIPAGSIVFFDDSARNVEAAASCGFEAHRIDGFGELERTLDRLGLT